MCLGGERVTRKFISCILVVFIVINTTQVSYASDGIEDKDLGISTIASTSWGYISEKYDVPLSKPWTITFSKEFDIDEIDGIVIQQEEKFIPVTI